VPAEVGEYLGLCPALAQLARTDRSHAAPEPQIASGAVSDSEPWDENARRVAISVAAGCSESLSRGVQNRLIRVTRWVFRRVILE